jgi:hypothetical protein
MGFDLVVQHELQCRTGDFVAVHDEHAPIVYGFFAVDADLHGDLLIFYSIGTDWGRFLASAYRQGRMFQRFQEK